MNEEEGCRHKTVADEPGPALVVDGVSVKIGDDVLVLFTEPGATGGESSFEKVSRRQWKSG